MRERPDRGSLDDERPVVREVPRPEADFSEAHAELCRRHIHAFGPTTPGAFA
jgi:hypothetical protein